MWGIKPWVTTVTKKESHAGSHYTKCTTHLSLRCTIWLALLSSHGNNRLFSFPLLSIPSLSPASHHLSTSLTTAHSPATTPTWSHLSTMLATQSSVKDDDEEEGRMGMCMMITMWQVQSRQPWVRQQQHGITTSGPATTRKCPRQPQQGQLQWQVWLATWPRLSGWLWLNKEGVWKMIYGVHMVYSSTICPPIDEYIFACDSQTFCVKNVFAHAAPAVCFTIYVYLRNFDICQEISFYRWGGGRCDKIS